MSQQRLWGVFCLENKTEQNIQWGTKGLIVKWNENHQPTNLPLVNNSIIRSSSKPDLAALMAANNSNLFNAASSMFAQQQSSNIVLPQNMQPVVELKHANTLLSIVRHTLPPNQFVMGNFPLFAFCNTSFVLVIELKIVKVENGQREKTITRAFHIAHGNHDVVLGIKISKPLFFSLYDIDVFVEPFTYRFCKCVFGFYLIVNNSSRT